MSCLLGPTRSGVATALMTSWTGQATPQHLQTTGMASPAPEPQAGSRAAPPAPHLHPCLAAAEVAWAAWGWPVMSRNSRPGSSNPQSSSLGVRTPLLPSSCVPPSPMTARRPSSAEAPSSTWSLRSSPPPTPAQGLPRAGGSGSSSSGSKELGPWYRGVAVPPQTTPTLGSGPFK